MLQPGEQGAVPCPSMRLVDVRLRLHARLDVALPDAGDRCAVGGKRPARDTAIVKC